MTRLPPADPLLVADTVAALPARLRTKLDAAVAQIATWVVDGHEVRLPGGAVVTLTPTDGALREPGQVRCECLLAPGCLHRASVLAAAPVAEQPVPGPRPAAPATQTVSRTDSDDEPSAAADDTAAGDTVGHVGDARRAAEHRAATAVATATSRVLDAGLPGAGATVQADLLRALHHARIHGLYRLAAAATRVVAAVRAGRDDDPAFRLRDLRDDLLEVLETAHMIRTGRGDLAPWRGRARTRYAPVGGLRLTGLCLEPVITDAGYAGVVVWLVDPDGRLWSVSDVRPGGPDRVRSSAHGPVALGATGLNHSRLSRAGLVLTGATANPQGRLGAGTNVRAVSVSGTPWSDPLLRARFGTAGPGPLALLDLTICASTSHEVLAVDRAGDPVRVTAPATPLAAFRDNLRILAGAPGLRLLAVGRRSPTQARTLELLAVGGEDLDLPVEFGGHADLGLDHLAPTFLRPSGPPPTYPYLPDEADPLDALTRRHERVVAGGRLTLTAPGAQPGVRADIAALRRSHLVTGADLLTSLTDAARPGERDTFGRLTSPDPDALARQWLAAGLYLRAAREHLRHA